MKRDKGVAMESRVVSLFFRRSGVPGYVPPVFLLVLFFLCICIVQQSVAAVIAVNTYEQETSPFVIDGDCTLGEAIKAANDDAPVDNCAAGLGDDTIILPAGTYALSAVDNFNQGNNGLPAVTSGITVVGAGSTAKIVRNGLADFRIFYVGPGGKLRLEGLQISGGAEIDGGGIYNDGGTLDLVRTTISENEAAERGGGIYNLLGPLSIIDCTITMNRTDTATGRGGGLFYAAMDNAMVSNSTISNNSAFEGGAIYTAHDAVLTVENDILNQNSAQRGGGIYIDTDGYLTISNTTLSENRSYEHGGGILSEDATFNLTNSTLAKNRADTAGGGIYSQGGGTFSITNSTLAENQGITGGAIYNASSPGTPVRLTNVTIANNDATLEGGGIFDTLGSTPVELVNAILADNKAPTGPNCRGDIDSLDYNLFENIIGCNVIAEPHDIIGPAGLAAYTSGGAGKGHFPLLATSQAIEAGNDAPCPPCDQIGNPRNDADGSGIAQCDIGSIEFQGPLPAPCPVQPQPPAFTNPLDSLKAQFVFYYNSPDAYGMDRLSITAHLANAAAEPFVMPFDKDVKVTVWVPDMDHPGELFQLFTQTVPKNAISGTTKYRYTSGGPGIRELTFMKRTDTSTYFYLYVQKVDLMACKRDHKTPTAYHNEIKGISNYTVRVEIEGDARIWGETAPLMEGWDNGEKQELNLNH